MKPHVLTLALAASAVGLAGCQNPNGTQNNTGSGALIGGAMGAVTGAAIGGSRHGGEGALIGAAAGVIAGGLVGNSMDREQEARLKAQAPQTYVKVDQGQPLSIADVKALAKAGISEDVIINQIQNSRTIYHLSAAAPAGTVVVQQAPPLPPAETVVVAAPGPGYVWIGGDYEWNGISWVWIGGHWGYPPYPHAVWISGHAWHDRYGWHHERGYWH